jgi:glycosyltransferase involved in cell wall biosynthesis
VTYTPASTIYHYGQSTPGRQEFDEENKRYFLSKWQKTIEPDLKKISQEDQIYNRTRTNHPRYSLPFTRGIHLAIDLSQPNAFTWACAQLALALNRSGETVTLPFGLIHRSIEPYQAKTLRSLMCKNPKNRFQIKWSHYWPGHLKRPLSGQINTEIFCTNYRYRQEGRVLDFWMRHVQVNGYRKLPVTSFNREALLEVGVSPEDCAIMPLGYSPEINSLFPEGRPLPSPSASDLNILVVTNSHDPHRYGTDLLIRALGQVFKPKDPVIVHVKDYGSTQGDDRLQQWIKAQDHFPRVVWHRQFLTKADLISLYAKMDILVAPFRGEGFGMKILDALALGIPVLMPAFGGPTDFITQDSFLPLAYKEVQVDECLDRQYYYIGEGAYWCEVDLENLVENLRSLPQRRKELLALGRAARDYVHDRFTWEQAADKLVQALQTWDQERTARVSVRRGPDALPLSVVIPTRNRETILEKTINGYRRQSLSADQFELLLINDHGCSEKLKSRLEANPAPFSIRLLENKGPDGPAAARNLGIEKARGEILLITGDDIIPDIHLLREHLNGHKRFPQLESAMLGRTLWHPDLEITTFMEMITGQGGEQFDYSGVRNNHPAPFGSFYTSNVSLKRAFLIEEEELFSTRYRYAAYEDIELAYRLHLAGMVLRYIESAKGYHDHAMSLKSFTERQRKAGRMLTLLSIQRPYFTTSEEGAAFLRSLDFARSSGYISANPENRTGWADELIQILTDCYETSLDLCHRRQNTNGRNIVDTDAVQWTNWLASASLNTWRTLNELILRSGMAEEWAVNENEADRAKDWLLMINLPRLLGPNKNYSKMPFTGFGLETIFSGSPALLRATSALRKIPLIRIALGRFKDSPLGKSLKAKLRK